MSNNNGSVVLGAFWMFLISVLLFWIPGVGGLIAGIVGGKAAGGVGKALLAAFLPAILLGAAFFFFASALTAFMPLAILAALGGLVLGCMHIGTLLLGAIIGGFLSS